VGEKMIVKHILLDEKYFLMLLSESSLRKLWNNKYDEHWDKIFI